MIFDIGFFSCRRGGTTLLLALVLVMAIAIMPVMADDGLADSAWPKFMHDNNNTGRSSYIGSQTNTVKWTYATGASISYSSATIGSDGTIYIGSVDGNFYAINPDGTKKWSYATGVVHSTAAIGSDGTIYIGSDSGLFALNPEGMFKWSYTTGAVYGSPAIGSDGTIYFGSYDKKIYALNSDGTFKWSYTTGNYVYSDPAIGTDGTIYVASRDNKIYALNSDGTFKWSYLTGGTIWGSPSIGMDGTIYCGSNDKKVYALNPDGTFKWSYTAGGYVQGTPAVGTNGTIYFGTYNDKKVYALNPDGTFKWSHTAGGYVTNYHNSAVIGADGTIYIGAYGDNNVYALNPDGTLKWSYAAGGKFINTPAIGPDGTVYIGNYDSKLYAFAGVLDYSADKTSGGAPLAVQFTGTSSLSITSWHWDFGDGTTSDEQNPSHTYSSTGFYTVKLTATNSDGTVYYHIMPNYIKVYSPPVAGFTASVTSGITPLSVTFNDQSTGEPTSWHWDFGDGTTSDEQNPTHTYTTTGSSTVKYTVYLTATNPVGSNTTSSTDYITLYSNLPEVSFTATPRIGTTAPLTVQFHDTSTLQPIAWLWDFGDGSSENATMQNPVHTYATAGTYTVNLTATNTVGSSTGSRPGFITFATPGLLPNNRHIFINVANDAGVKYDSDGATYGGPSNTYYIKADGGGMNALSFDQLTTTTNTSGTFNVIDGGGSGGSQEFIILIAVQGPIPDDFSATLRSNGDDTQTGTYVTGAVNETFTKDDFYYGPHIYRPGPGTLGVWSLPLYYDQNTSDPSTASYFAFVDLNVGGRSANVEFSFNNLTTIASFSFYAWRSGGNQGQGISWTNNPGTSGYMVIGIPDAPIADFTSSTNNADILSPVQFTDTSVNVPQSWFWEFGDGATSAEQNPVHTYAAPGTYTVNLTVTNYKGTDTITKTGYVTKISPSVPVVDFSTNVTSGVSPVPVQFTDQSTGLIFSWLWDFGDGTTSTEQNPLHWYAPGTYSVNLKVTNSGGSNSTLKTSYITVTSNGRTNQFRNPGFETGTLDNWSKSSDISLLSSTSHTGSYAVFTSNDPYASEFVEQYVDLTSATNISFWGYIPATSSSIFYLYIDGANVWSTTPATSWTQYTIPVSGYSGVHLVRVTYYHHYQIAPAYLDDFCAGSGDTCGSGDTPADLPVASFTASPTSGPVPLTVTFTDTSTGSPVSWAWDFDGDDSPDSNDQNPSYNFTTAGTYPVKLTVTDASGATDDEIQTITVGEDGPTPVPEFPVVAFPVMVISALAFLAMVYRKVDQEIP